MRKFSARNWRGSGVAAALGGARGRIFSGDGPGPTTKQAHDIVGTYKRADIFSPSVDMSRPVILRANNHAGEPNHGSIERSGQRSWAQADAPASTTEDQVVVTNNLGPASA